MCPGLSDVYSSHSVWPNFDGFSTSPRGKWPPPIPLQLRWGLYAFWLSVLSECFVVCPCLCVCVSVSVFVRVFISSLYQIKSQINSYDTLLKILIDFEPGYSYENNSCEKISFYKGQCKIYRVHTLYSVRELVWCQRVHTRALFWKIFAWKKCPPAIVARDISGF